MSQQADLVSNSSVGGQQPDTVQQKTRFFSRQTVFVSLYIILPVLISTSVAELVLTATSLTGLADIYPYGTPDLFPTTLEPVKLSSSALSLALACVAAAIFAHARLKGPVEVGSCPSTTTVIRRLLTGIMQADGLLASASPGEQSGTEHPARPRDDALRLHLEPPLSPA